MKTIVLLLGLILPFAGSAQSYTIDWYKVSGGGGTSTNAQYALSGTTGQSDAGTMSGGNYTLQGGFWGVVAAVQTPGAPLLTITLNSQPSTFRGPRPQPALGCRRTWGWTRRPGAQCRRLTATTARSRASSCPPGRGISFVGW